MQNETYSIRVILPTWFAQAFEERLETVLHKRGCVRLVEELGEVSGVEVIEWIDSTKGGMTETLSLTIRQHNDASSLIEIGCSSRRLRNLVLVTALRLLSECIGAICNIDVQLKELLSRMHEEIERKASQIEGELEDSA